MPPKSPIRGDLNIKENLKNKMSLSYFLKVPPYGGFRGHLEAE
jgi:hypothetical protein